MTQLLYGIELLIGKSKMPAIFERSLIRMGQGGLVVTLPKPWLAYYKLKAGDRVVLLTNGKLVIKPKPRRKSVK